MLPVREGFALGWCGTVSVGTGSGAFGALVDAAGSLGPDDRTVQMTPRTCAAWVVLLQSVLQELFGDGRAWSGELQTWTAALEDWRMRASDCALELDIAVVLEILNEALSVESGRFGHRTGSLTISALEPMRAIPHKVIVLMGLDGAAFPRPNQRPGFHLLEQQRRLGDPRGSDQDRYVLLEALMSARRHLLISWCGRNERTGEAQPPSGSGGAVVGSTQAGVVHQQHRRDWCFRLLLIPLARSNFYMLRHP